MIEDLTMNISYEKYFNQCSPHMCTYTNTRRHGIVFITERIIELLVGLTLVLRLTVPIIARLIRRIINYKSSGGVPHLSTDVYYGTVHNPDENQFDRLQKNYSTNSSCPCSATSLQYSTFLSIEPRYHQLCSSDFVSLVYHINEYYRLDYRLSDASSFYFVNLFCTEAKETVDRALTVFLQTQLVNTQVLAREFSESQSNSLIQNWQSTTR
ncbi:unnamed protein product [Adineta ricciae]|uniref:Uncharacterized protein n=1 Tax=Adineta ricciae TaxID=249248 RepID=A0A815E6H7_ADIRI|nr:unnamed protein product [Adineta ricciae]CAF1459086.1 unnamed protein product [Adineta ricciae]